MTSVLHLLSSSEFHGAEAAVLELCKGQRAVGIEASVLLFGTHGGDAVRTRFESAKVPVENLGVRGRLDYSAARQLAQVVTRDGISVLHSHKYKCTPYALFAARRKHVSVVSTYHNWLFETRLLQLYARLDKFLARYCDACVAVSSPVADELRRHVPAKRVSVVHNGIDTARWLPAKRADGTSRPLIVGFVGRVSSAKGADQLIDALALVERIGGRPVHGLFVGDGELRTELERRAEAPELAGRVTFLGNIDDVAEYYAQMDVIALPSTNEGCPMVLLEAMAMGVPAIASRVGDVPQLVLDGETGRLLEANEPAALARAIEQVLGDDGARAGMAAKSRELIEERFSLELMVNAYSGIYDSVRAATG